jgi:hypothetical protein
MCSLGAPLIVGREGRPGFQSSEEEVAFARATAEGAPISRLRQQRAAHRRRLDS